MRPRITKNTPLFTLKAFTHFMRPEFFLLNGPMILNSSSTTPFFPKDTEFTARRQRKGCKMILKPQQVEMCILGNTELKTYTNSLADPSPS